MQTLILVAACLGAVHGGVVRRAVPASSYVRTEEGEKVVIPGLETTTTADIDNALGEVFGQTTLAQESDAASSTGYPSSSADSSEVTTATAKPTTKQPISLTTQKPSTGEKVDITSSTSSTTTAAPSSSSESSPSSSGSGFGFGVAFPTVPSLDKIKIPNPLGGLFSG